MSIERRIFLIDFVMHNHFIEYQKIEKGDPLSLYYWVQMNPPPPVPPEYGQPTTLQKGGRVAQTGWAVVDEGEFYSGVGAGAVGFGTQINITGPIYGFDDFVEKVRLAGVDLSKRGL